MRVALTAEIMVNNLTVSALKEALAKIPDTATVQVVTMTGDRMYSDTHKLKFTWSEER